MTIKRLFRAFNHSKFKTLTSDEHGNDGEDLLGVGVGRDVAEADACKTGAGEVECRDVGRHSRHVVQRLIDDLNIKLLGQLIEPPFNITVWRANSS